MAEMDSVDAQIAVNGAYAQAEAFVATNIEGFEPDQVGDVAKLVDELGQAFATNRLSYLAEVAAEYPARKRGGGGGGYSRGSKKAGSSSDAATAPQVNLINVLLGEKAGADAALEAFGDVDSLTKKTASDAIEALMALEDA